MVIGTSLVDTGIFVEFSKYDIKVFQVVAEHTYRQEPESSGNTDTSNTLSSLLWVIVVSKNVIYLIDVKQIKTPSKHLLPRLKKTFLQGHLTR